MVWSGNCCIVVTLLCSLTRLLLSLLHLLPQSSSEGFSCATIHHLEFWCILKRLLFMYWPEAREGVCVSFKIHLALEGKAGGGRWTNQPTTLTELRCCWQKWEHAVFCWHGKGGSKCRKLTLQVTMQLRHIFTEIAANGRGEHMLCIKETTISRCQRVAWGRSNFEVKWTRWNDWESDKNTICFIVTSMPIV